MALRIGIEQMQVSLLVDQARRWMSSPQPPTADDLTVDVAAQVERIDDLGFKLIELNTDLTIFFPHCYDLPALERLCRVKQERHLDYTVHLPLWSLEPSTPAQMVREGAVDTLVDAVLRLAPLEPEVYVLHATGALAAEFWRMKALEHVRPLVMRLFSAQARVSVEQLLTRTGLPSRRVAIETIEFPFELTWGLAQALDLCMCLDVGHVVAGYTADVTLPDALERVLPRLAEVHLHDAYRRPLPDGTPRIADHLPLGAGDVPLGMVLDRLGQAHFTGPIVLELTLEEAQASMQVMRALRPELIGP